MDFSFSEEQMLLKESARRFIAKQYQPQQHRDLRTSSQGFSEEHWSLMCKLGWTGLTVGEEAGGYGGSIIDLMLLCEELGRGPILEPYLPSLPAVHILSGCEGPLACSALKKLVVGDNKISTALYEPGCRFALDCSRTKAIRSNDCFELSGQKTSVMYAQFADKFIVAAQLAEEDSQETIALFLLDAKSKGLEVRPYRILDGRHAAELILDKVVVPGEACLISGPPARQLLENALDAVIIGQSADSLGAMVATLDTTLAYCKDRQQFGQPISKFQALQHTLADMFMLCEAVRSLLYAAATEFSRSGDDAHAVIAALKSRVAESGRLIAEQAVQLHGGMGFTEELHLAQYYKRLVCNATLYGDADHHLTEYLLSKR